MTLFRRVLRFLFLLAGVTVGLITAVAAFFARRMVAPPRQPLWATPADLGMAFEEVQFPAKDGVRLSGWFIPAGEQANGATLVFVHGWGWNRLGEAAIDPVFNLLGVTGVDFLRLAFALHQEGYQLLLYDSRNHGQSAAAAPVTFGRAEAQDLLGALAYLNGRTDVDSARLGVIGFSMGANTLLYALSQTKQIAAAIAVQPTTLSVFARRFARDITGPLGLAILPITQMMYRAGGGQPFERVRPGTAAAQAGDVPVLFVQGTGDPWGDADDVAQIAAATPAARGPLFVEALSRYDGYQYLVDNPKVAAAFFEQHLP